MTAVPDIDEVKAFCLETPMSLRYALNALKSRIENHGGNVIVHNWSRGGGYLIHVPNGAKRIAKELRADMRRLGWRCSVQQTGYHPGHYSEFIIYQFNRIKRQ